MCAKIGGRTYDGICFKSAPLASNTDNVSVCVCVIRHYVCLDVCVMYYKQHMCLDVCVNVYEYIYVYMNVYMCILMYIYVSYGYRYMCLCIIMPSVFSHLYACVLNRICWHFA
jgi:hypothetical protein